jgi:two-component system, NarL family, sensor kinase
VSSLAARLPVASRPVALPRLALAGAAAAVLCVVVGAVLAVLTAGTPRPEGTDFVAGQFAGTLGFGLAGGLLASRLPGNAVGWVALAVGLSQGAGLVTSQWAVLALLAEPGAGLPGGEAALWVAWWVWAPGYLLVPTLLLLLLPDGRPPGRRWAPLVPLALVAAAGTALWFAATPYDQTGEPVLVPGAGNPAASAALSAVAGWLALLAVPAVAGCVAAFAVRVRRARGGERQRLRWVVAGVAAALVLLVAGQTLGDAVAGPALAAAFAVLPACLLVAVLRDGLWELGPVGRRSVGAAVLAALALALYGTVAVLTSEALGALAAVLVVLVHPRVDRGVNRLLYGDRDEPWLVVRRVGDRLAGEAAPGGRLRAAEREVARALRLTEVRVGGEDEDGLALVHHGERVGTLVVRGRELGPADDRALRDLAPQLAAAARASRLEADLRRSRERLVAAREEERLRLRNDLHDDLGPSLAVLAMRLDAAGQRELARQARDGLASVRRIVQDLRPAALDDLGLARALEEQVRSLREGGIDARLEVAGREALDTLPPALGVAAYRIAREALTNVVKHARADACTVRIDAGPDALVVEVADDGRGIGTRGAKATGVGLRSMRTRAEELGGTLEVADGEGGRGTVVRATLPAGPAP